MKKYEYLPKYGCGHGHYLESGKFIATKKELLSALKGREVLAMAHSLGKNEAYDFDAAFSLLFSWCKETLIRI